MTGRPPLVSLRHGTGSVSLATVEVPEQPDPTRSPEAFIAAIDASIAEGRPFAIAMLDVDDFSLVEDRGGLTAADMVRTVSDVISAVVLPLDTAVRHWGDGFALVLATEDPLEAHDTVESIRVGVEEALWEAGAVTVTVCCGVGYWDPQAGTDVADLLATADDALSAARMGGKSRVVLAEGEESISVPIDLGGRDDLATVRPGEIRDLLYLCSASAHLRTRLSAEAERLGLVAVEDEGALVLMMVEGTMLLESIAEHWSAAELRQVLARTTSSTSGGVSITLPATELLRRLVTPWLPRLLSERALRHLLQPIRGLADGACVGHEALMRGHLDGVDYSAPEIIEAAQAHDLSFAMDVIAWTAALDHGLPQLGENERLHVNLLPPAADDLAAYLHTVDTLAGRCEMSRVVVEITEPEGSAHVEQHDALAAAHHRLGAGVALDRVGAGVHTLRRISELRPDMVKLAMDLTRDLVPNDPRIGLVRAVADHAHSCGALVVAVGIETVAECVALRELGVDLGQGHYLGRPE